MTRSEFRFHRLSVRPARNDAPTRGPSPRPTPPRGYRFVRALWITYFGILPLEWFPSVPIDAIRLAKGGLLVGAVFLTVASASDRTIPKGLAGPIGLALLAVSAAFSMFQAPSLFTSLRQVGEIVVAFLVMWTIRSYQRSIGDFARIASSAVLIHGLWSVPIVLSYAGRWAIRVPAQFGDHFVFETGFAAARTGWSSSVAILLPFAVAIAVTTASKRERAWLVAATAVTIVGQTLVGGRAGLLASLIGVGVVVWVRFGLRGAALSLAGIVGVSLAFPSVLGERLRFTRLTTPGIDVLETLSTGRVAGYRQALELIDERPLFGHGFGQPIVDYGLGSGRGRIHNVWLRLAAEGGVLLTLALAAVVLNVVALGISLVKSLSRRHLTRESLYAAAALGAVSAGVVLSVFEASTILGNMFDATMWWASAGALAAGATGYLNNPDQSRP